MLRDVVVVGRTIKNSCLSSTFYAYMWFCFYNYGSPLRRPSGHRSSAMNKLIRMEGVREWVPSDSLLRLVIDVIHELKIKITKSIKVLCEQTREVKKQIKIFLD